MSKEYEELIAGVNFRILLDVRDQRIQELEGKNAELCRDLNDAYHVLNSSLEPIVSQADALRIAAAHVLGTCKNILWECRQVQKRIEELEGGKDE